MFSFTGRVCLLSFLVFAAYELTAQTLTSPLDYGLAFASHEVTKDQRTSLNLSPDGPFHIHEDFELKFDISYQRLTNAFGYILRIVANDSLNIDLVSSPEHSEFHDLNLIIKDSPIKLHYDFDEIHMQPLQWNEVTIAISFKSNRITLSWNGNKKAMDFPTSNLEEFHFLFGANDFGKFNTSDVPPVSLRNIEIVQNKKPFLKFELKKHGINTVYDTKLETAAATKNPVWLMDRHVKWIHRKEISIAKYPSVAFDKTSGFLYIADATALYTMDIKTGKVEKTNNAKGSVTHTDANQLLYVEETGELNNYDVFTKKLAKYNFTQKSWTNTDTSDNEPRYAHNNKFYNPFDGALYTFGGYGFFSYSNAFYKFDESQGKWLTVETSGSIPPRYLAALGLTRAKDKALIFGGYGSKSGNQEISPQSFYDLHSFDLRTHEIKQIWEEETPQSLRNIVFSNSLVINEQDSCFYVLSYPKDKYKSYIKLRSYSLKHPLRTELGDSIPFLFHDVNSFSDLFYSKDTKELIAVTAHKEADQYKVHVYSINYPPLKIGDTLQVVPTKFLQAGNYYVPIAGTGIVAIIFGIFIFRNKRTRAGNVIADKAATHDRPTPVHAEIFLEPGVERISTIDLFGGFQVIDKAGIDITHKFTATVKELFIFILLHSVRLEKGISTTVLHEFLWPDKDEVNARNNRNVNLKKLRKLFEEIGDISIENTTSYVRLILHDTVSCDYQTAYRILNSGKMDGHKIEILMKYVSRGSLLPNMQAIWLDTFKSEISNRIIDVLLAYSSELDMYKDDKMLLDIADSIFNYDTINQEAMVIKCSVLNKRGKHSLAKNWYDHFAKEYMNLYGENYPKSFEEIVS